MNNFDLKNFLTENKLTSNSKLLNENYRERNDNLQFIINVLKAGKTSPIIEIFEKIVENNDNDNLDQEIDQAVEEVIDEDESLKKYLDYESSKGSMYYGDMKEVKVGDKLKHKRTGAEMEVTKVSGDELTMKYTSVGTQPGAKVGGINKTSAKLIGKSYDLI